MFNKEFFSSSFGQLPSSPSLSSSSNSSSLLLASSSSSSSPLTSNLLNNNNNNLGLIDGDRECSSFNSTLCSDGHCPRKVIKCIQDNNLSVVGREKYCYTLWSNSTEDGIVIKQEGCLTGHNYDCNNSSKCIASSPNNKGLYFCCCRENLCNKDIYLVSKIPEYSPPQATTSETSGSSYLLLWSYILIPVITVLFLLAFVFWFRRQHPLRSTRFSEDEESVPITDQINGSNGANGCVGNGSAGRDSAANKSIKLLDKLSTGRFGSVWKARLIANDDDHDHDNVAANIGGDTGGKGHESCGKLVAVKILPSHERSSWVVEQLVFTLPQIEHENILPFIGCEKREDPNSVPFSSSEYWLITEYHPLGSLCDYLKLNTVNIDELIQISSGIAAGLTHLHDEIPASKGLQMKPAIVHRDLKSRNILLRADLTPRIADFGLCLIYYPNRPPVGLGQVGTRRYMAPEVLEGAINYTRDSLFRIDVYACSLVLWELLSRCRGDEEIESIVPNIYKLPFEEDVGQNPSLEDMQETVCQAKKRPSIRQQWLSHPSLKVICETIEECWDQDAEARLSASCILERLTILAKNRANTKA